MNIDIEKYDYCLPEELIAQFPSKKRENSKLLLYNKGIIGEDRFKSITTHLPSDSLLVFNNTRVIRARILFKKDSGSTIELFCLEPLSPPQYEETFASTESVEWKCIIGNLKKWKKGTLTKTSGDKKTILSAEKIEPQGEAWRIRFTWTPKETSFGEIIDQLGYTPLPPYIKRDATLDDNIRYQTVYSRISGSVAAPTAGLHFTDEVLDSINKKGINSTEITLHVGAGTFKPVKSRDIADHKMHCEHFYVTKATIETLLNKIDKIIAVGTTTVRTLESIYWIGVKIINEPGLSETKFHISQWEPYSVNDNIPSQKTLRAILDYMEIKGTDHISASTEVIILPGYKFNMINGLITNFHQPKSTLLLLLAAWVGPDWTKIYRFAIENKFRFLSYGDSSLLM